MRLRLTAVPPPLRPIKYFADKQFLRFIIVGGLNVAFAYGIYALMLWLGLHYSLATLIATILSILFNFKTYGTLVFRNPDNRLIFRFVAVYGIPWPLTVVALGALKSLGLSAYLAGAIMMLPMSLLTFYLNRRLVFSRAAYRKDLPVKEAPAYRGETP